MASAPQLLIDIGQHSVKALLVSGGKKGISVRQAAKIPLEMPSNAPSEDIQAKTLNVLGEVIQKVGGKGKRAAIALQGRQAFSRPVTVPLIRGRQLDRIIRYEARQQIPFPIDQVNLDYHVHDIADDASDLNVTILAVRKEIADDASKMIRQAGAKADVIDVGPLALFNAYKAAMKPDPDEVTAVVSIGASGTDIVIEQNGDLRFMRSAPIGGNTLTGMLAKELSIDWSYAEQLKSKAADAYGSKEEEANIAPEDVAAVLERGFEQIVTEIRRSLDFYVSQAEASSVTRIFLSGGTCNMEGVVEFLEERLGVVVEQSDFTQMEGLTWDAGDREAFALEATLMGLAARLFVEKPMALNVAPSSTLQRLDFERRLPLLAVATVALVLILGGSYMMMQQTLGHMREARDRMLQIVRPGGGGQLDENVKQLQTLTDELKVFGSRFERLEEVLAKRGERTRYYNELANVVPEDVWLSSMNARSDKLIFSGKTVGDRRLMDLLNAIRLSPYFADDAVFLTEQGTDEGSLTFTLEIAGFRQPTPEEVKFVELLLKANGTDYELVKAVIDRGEDGSNPPLAILGTLEFQEEKGAFNALKRVYEALQSSNLSECEKIQWRAYDRTMNEKARTEIAVENIQKYTDGSLNDEEFRASWSELEVPPTPTPTPTPLPEGMEAGMGMYGMYGMMGMGGFGMPMGGGAGG